MSNRKPQKKPSRQPMTPSAQPSQPLSPPSLGMRMSMTTVRQSGPIPDPITLRQYDDLSPGAGQAIMREFTTQMDHQRAIELRNVKLSEDVVAAEIAVRAAQQSSEAATRAAEIAVLSAQQAAEINIQTAAQTNELALATRGQWFGLFAAFSGFAASAWCIYKGSEVAGTLIGTVDLVALVSVFVVGKYFTATAHEKPALDQPTDIKKPDSM